MLKKILVLGAVVLMLSGCNNAETKDNGTLGGAYSNAGGWVNLPNGKKVLCVVYGKGGVSCDWEHVTNV